MARRTGPALLLIALVLALLSAAGGARAWVEVHVGGDDVRLMIDRAGAARVEHKVTLKISGGPLRSFDVPGVDADAAPEPDGYVVPLKDAQASSLASASAVALELLPRDARPREDGTARPPALRVRFDGKGLSRGIYVLFFRYRTDLRGRGLLRQDGALSSVTWHSPIWDDGLDSARIVIELPLAPTEPRVNDAADNAAGEAAGPSLAPPLTLSTLRRGRDKDELELVRPYAPRGESIRWAMLADARAFQPEAPELQARGNLPVEALQAAASWSPERQRTLYFVGGALLFALYSALVAGKGLEVARHCRAAGVAPRPLVPMPLALRAAAAGVALVAGVCLQILLKTATLGALLVAGAAAFAAHRTPRRRRGAKILRGPGKWLPVAEAEAFRTPPRLRGAYLDVSTRAGKVLLAALLAVLGAGVYAMHPASPYHAYLLALDAAALLAVFCTGRLTELPPDPAARPVVFLRDVARRVKQAMKSKGIEARVVGRVRIPDGSPDADELRLGLLPRAALPGFVGIEVGVVYAPGAGGAIALPEVLLRVTAGSPCERAVERLSRSGRSSRGRRPAERVIAFAPRLPTAGMTATIAAALGRAVAAPAPPAAPVAAAKKPQAGRPRRAKKKEAAPAAA